MNRDSAALLRTLAGEITVPCDHGLLHALRGHGDATTWVRLTCPACQHRQLSAACAGCTPRLVGAYDHARDRAWLLPCPDCTRLSAAADYTFETARIHPIITVNGPTP